MCRLTPLALCLPSVSAEFARLTSRLGLMDCRPLLAQQAAQPRPLRPLEMFFPFDPYLLAGSARLLDLSHTYIRWHGGHPRVLMDDRADDDEDGEQAADSDVSSDDELPGADDSGDTQFRTDTYSVVGSYVVRA
jgi:RNA polymerase I-specific transcription initiation factor RRN3